ncbi:AraC family transcriptional regulator [Myxococcus llanfairpwllgwyngyllgogerychwyrndrobwllllantysiliogogogochensis]|uniref:AraC family transcriptional regulator n=1 Tax=Myxococcus llanfairpwllgwyngyllgogerychwyrndrobwllllantysiliogogogochensis TaxID=2590453 RepID=A0A540X4N3_9BACT|nr:AraC family transcriptional regulator [Myxococcus llanfairpwllgwyngyllgogerychwyrndrobwllllantysiliogogogochensis]TQF16208.1 AraC family transcriptional regulator [Myxococcus llanfairpwllgwyngyllgogerychwyrndrobwllllantysiliogogogochensis]
MATPSISTRLPRLILDTVAAKGVNADALARRAGVDRTRLTDAHTRIALPRGDLLWENAAAAVGDPHFGLHLATTFEPGQFDLFDYLCRTAATLGAGLHLASRHLRLLHDGAELSLTLSESRATLRYHCPNHPAGPGRQEAEFTLARLLTFAREATGQPLIPFQVGFTQAAPRGRNVLAEAFGTTRLAFRQESCTLTLPRDMLSLPLRQADGGLHALLLRHVDLLAREATPPVGWRERLHAQVEEEVERGEPSLARVCARLGMSPRGLQRRLKAAGRTFREVTEDVRLEKARRLLADDSLNVAGIAERVGYSDARALRRAFQRWTGMSPGRYRRSTSAA